MKHRKGSIARMIQDYLLSNEYDRMFGTNSVAWCWLPLPNSKFCVALEWQGGYDKDDKHIYGKFMDNEYVINASIKMTDEFAINGEYALYAETYYIEDGDYIEGGLSLTEDEMIGADFYYISDCLAEMYNSLRLKKPTRAFL